MIIAIIVIIKLMHEPQAVARYNRLELFDPMVDTAVRAAAFLQVLLVSLSSYRSHSLPPPEASPRLRPRKEPPPEVFGDANLSFALNLAQNRKATQQRLYPDPRPPILFSTSVLKSRLGWMDAIYLSIYLSMNIYLYRWMTKETKTLG